MSLLKQTALRNTPKQTGYEGISVPGISIPGISSYPDQVAPPEPPDPPEFINVVVNGTFDDATFWRLDSGWTIANGVASCTTIDRRIMWQQKELTLKQVYFVRIDVMGPPESEARFVWRRTEGYYMDGGYLNAGRHDFFVQVPSGQVGFGFQATDCNLLPLTIDNFVMILDSRSTGRDDYVWEETQSDAVEPETGGRKGRRQT